MQEKRLIKRLTEHWSQLKGEALYPQFEKLNPAVLSDVWDQCIMLEVDKGSKKPAALYTYHYMGKDIIQVYGSDLTGQHVNTHMHNFPGWQVLKSVDDVIVKPQIQVSLGSFMNDLDQLVKYRACIMPFGANDVVTHALIGLSWKTFQ